MHKAIAVDQAGNVYVTGYTGSNDFPYILQVHFNVSINQLHEWDVFVSKFDSDLSTFI